MTLLFISVGLLLLYLIVERIRIDQWHRAIPLRISVTGTRGKTTVVRLLASVLRENGSCVLAKTTGSSPQLILPDGSERTIKRRGMPTILEQKKLLSKAAQEKADVLISEVMSIHPENHYIESQRILKPHLVILTNIRDDHRDAMGSTDEELTDTFCPDIPKSVKMFLPKKEMRTQLKTTIEQKYGTLHLAPTGLSQKRMDQNFDFQFTENLDLVFAVADHLGIKSSIIRKGISKAIHDLGAVEVWTYRQPEKSKRVYLVNAFAANDPFSTKQVLEKAKSLLPTDVTNWIGILNCRADRGDRTKQWITELKTTNHFNFTQLFVIGDHIHAVGRALSQKKYISEKKPERIMQFILDRVKEKSVIFGFGNFGGLGKQCVQYWQLHGEKYVSKTPK